MATHTIDELVTLACHDLFTMVVEVNNKTTHEACLQYTGPLDTVYIQVYKTDRLSDRIYNEGVFLNEEMYTDGDTSTIIRKIKRVCADLKAIITNDYANQHSLEPKREVRHA